jgi:hypothetical protein
VGARSPCKLRLDRVASEVREPAHDRSAIDSEGLAADVRRGIAAAAAVSSPATRQASTARSEETSPTATQLARMPWRPHSAAVTLVSICSAALADA